MNYLYALQYTKTQVRSTECRVAVYTALGRTLITSAGVRAAALYGQHKYQKATCSSASGSARRQSGRGLLVEEVP